MIVVFKNFMRNKMVNLSAVSVKHFLPDTQIFCVTMYKDNHAEEYAEQEPLHDYITQILCPTKYVGDNKVYDDVDSTKTSGFANSDNGAYFVEGYNVIYSIFHDLPDKLLMLSEDHFFTTGETLKELLATDWDVAYGDGDSEAAGCLKANGSILGIVPAKVAHCFPMPEFRRTTVEWIVGQYLCARVPPDRLHSISTRNWIDYCGDGMYTNSSQDMINMMKEAGII